MIGFRSGNSVSANTLLSVLPRISDAAERLITEKILDTEGIAKAYERLTELFTKNPENMDGMLVRSEQVAREEDPESSNLSEGPLVFTPEVYDLIMANFALKQVVNVSTGVKSASSGSEHLIINNTNRFIYSLENVRDYVRKHLMS